MVAAESLSSLPPKQAVLESLLGAPPPPPFPSPPPPVATAPLSDFDAAAVELAQLILQLRNEKVSLIMLAAHTHCSQQVLSLAGQHRACLTLRFCYVEQLMSMLCSAGW